MAAVALAAACLLPGCSGCSGLHLRGHMPPARPYGVMQAVAVGDTIVLPARFRSFPAPLAGAHLAAAFRSPTLRDRYLAPTRPVGQLAGRTFTLADVLVSTDWLPDSVTAGWTVAGPESVIRPYVKALERATDDRSVFYDFNAVFVPVKYCCAE